MHDGQTYAKSQRWSDRGCYRLTVPVSQSTPPATDDKTRCQTRVLEACNMPVTRVVAARGHDNAIDHVTCSSKKFGTWPRKAFPSLRMFRKIGNFVLSNSNQDYAMSARG